MVGIWCCLWSLFWLIRKQFDDPVKHYVCTHTQGQKMQWYHKANQKLKLPSNYHEINTLKSKCVEIFQRFTTFEMKCMNSYEIEMHSEAMKNYEQWYICDIKMNSLAQKENARGSEIQLNRQIVTISINQSDKCMTIPNYEIRLCE